jgi:hypothetical protein
MGSEVRGFYGRNLRLEFWNLDEPMHYKFSICGEIQTQILSWCSRSKTLALF